MNQFCCKLAHVVNGAKGRNDKVWESGLRRSKVKVT